MDKSTVNMMKLQGACGQRRTAKNMDIAESNTALALRIGASPPKPNHLRGAFLSAAIRCFATPIIVSGAAAERPGKTFSNVVGRLA
jgi:hypothetical protein